MVTIQPLERQRLEDCLGIKGSLGPRSPKNSRTKLSQKEANKKNLPVMKVET